MSNEVLSEQGTVSGTSFGTASKGCNRPTHQKTMNWGHLMHQKVYPYMTSLGVRMCRKEHVLVSRFYWALQSPGWRVTSSPSTMFYQKIPLRTDTWPEPMWREMLWVRRLGSGFLILVCKFPSSEVDRRIPLLSALCPLIQVSGGYQPWTWQLCLGCWLASSAPWQSLWATTTLVPGCLGLLHPQTTPSTGV